MLGGTSQLLADTRPALRGVLDANGVPAAAVPDASLKETSFQIIIGAEQILVWLTLKPLIRFARLHRKRRVAN